MFDNYFYHERLRKTVAIFGSLFTKIYVIRTDSNNKVMSSVRVPLAYSPRSKFLARLQQVGEFGKDDSVAIKLPRLSFEMTSIAYDSTRQLAKTNTQLRAATVDDSKQRAKIRQSTPYIVTFSLGVYANNQDDALQIVEQILPYFQPEYSVSITPVSGFEYKQDVPIILTSVTISDDYEGDFLTRRALIYQLDFTMKMKFFGPTGNQGVIRGIEVDLNSDAGNTLNLEDINFTITPANADEDDNYTVTTTIT